MSRVTLISPERIRRRMAGVGVRYLEMARSLSRGHEVTLLAPNADLPEEPGIRLDTYGKGRFRELTRDAEVVVVHGHVSNDYLAEVDGIPTVMDLYDPFLVENLHYAPLMGEEVFLYDHATLTRQLLRGDFFLCFTPYQRLFYLGMLQALGRVNPDNFLEDRNLDRLIAIVPFGIPRREPVRGEPMIRGVVGGIEEDDLLLFYGGVYDWHDPLTSLHALERLDRGPTAAAGAPAPKILFVRNPNPEATPQARFEELRRWSREKGWEGTRVFFLDWIDYDRRESAYMECDLALATFPQGLEADLSFRTRVLDWLWCGLPVVVTGGGWTGELLRREDAGEVVAPGDPQALAGALARLTGDSRRRGELAENGRRLARREFRWDRLLEPLDRFCREPRAAGDKPLAARARSGVTGGGRGSGGNKRFRWLGR